MSLKQSTWKGNVFSLLKYFKVFNPINGLKIRNALNQKDSTVSIRVKGIKHPMLVRTGTSDVETFEQVFVYKQYELQFTEKAKFIIDGGANVGFASILFANKFPDAKIIAIEPEESNYRQLQANTKYYPNIQAVQSGIWNDDVYLRVRDAGLGHWGFVVEEVRKGDKGAFKATSIGSILKASGTDKIDILKLDIEGSEKEVFTKNYDNWLSRTDMLIIELHPQMKPGSDKVFYDAISPFNFEISTLRENVVLRRRNI